MIGLAPSVFKGATSAPDPIAIFGANLTAWYDSRVGVTPSGGSPDRVNRWDEQSGNGRWATNATPTTVNSPKYIASDTDGTPSIWWDPTEFGSTRLLKFSAGLLLTPQQTVYAFVELDASTSIQGLMWSATGNTGLYTHSFNGIFVTRPGIWNTTWFVSTDNLTTWGLLRYSGNNTGPLRSIAVDASAQGNSAASWPGTSPAWTDLSDSGNLQYFRGKIKQLVITDTFVQDADAEHAAMLAYFKATYPTLVTY